MASLIVKLDKDTLAKARARGSTKVDSDIDMLTPRVGVLEQVPMAYGDESVKQAIRNILMWRLGESVISPEFGHGLNKSMYQQITDMNRQQACEELKRAIEENEPRVEVISISMGGGSDSEEE